jgi:hypothetical protein
MPKRKKKVARRAKRSDENDERAFADAPIDMPLLISPLCAPFFPALYLHAFGLNPLYLRYDGCMLLLDN